MELAVLIIIMLLILLMNFGFSYFGLRKENKLLRELKPRDLWLIKERIKLMDSRDFEVFCGQLYSFLGYRSFVTKATKDGGKDIVLFKDHEYIFVECKHWTEIENQEDSYVGQDIGQKLKGAMDYGFDGKKSINRGIIIATTDFTDQCKIYCKAMNIELVNFDGIMELVETIGTEDVYIACGIKRDGWILE